MGFLLQIDYTPSTAIAFNVMAAYGLINCNDVN